MKKMYKIVALFGKAGSGKDTILNKIFDLDITHTYNKIISNTTRPPREHEKDGVDYHFLSDTQYLEKLNNSQIIEHSEFRKWYYGTSYDNLDENKINIGVFNPTGVLSLLNNKNVKVMPIFIECEDKERLLRQLNREDNPDVEEIVRRFGTDKEDFIYFDEHYPKEVLIQSIDNGYGIGTNYVAKKLIAQINNTDWYLM